MLTEGAKTAIKIESFRLCAVENRYYKSTSKQVEFTVLRLYAIENRFEICFQDEKIRLFGMVFGEPFLSLKTFAELLMILQNLFGFLSSLKKNSASKSFKNG